MSPLARLLADVEAEARRESFDLCLETYAAAGRDPLVPLLTAGSLDARFCAVGRELGREEVQHGEPLIGMAGRRFRRAFHEALIGPVVKAERRFDAVLDHALLTNLVPYRPVGNKAYGVGTRERFRPFVERLLADLWTGDQVLALGQHAFLWFAPYAGPGEVAAVWADREGRFQAQVPIRIRGRSLTLLPVPHPSPLSPFKAEFATLLAGRIAPG
jgi:uracil-DNA glycosylase